MEWARRTKDGTLSDIDFQVDAAVWAQVCSEAFACTPRHCGGPTGCFFQMASSVLKYSSSIPKYSIISTKYLSGNSPSNLLTKATPSSLVRCLFLISCAASYDALPIPNFMKVV